MVAAFPLARCRNPIDRDGHLRRRRSRAGRGYPSLEIAGVAKLVDATGLGPVGRKPLEVRVLSPALAGLALVATLPAAARGAPTRTRRGRTAGAGFRLCRPRSTMRPPRRGTGAFTSPAATARSGGST